MLKVWLVSFLLYLCTIKQTKKINKMTIFNNQSEEATKCNELINAAIKLQEEGKATVSTSTNQFGEDVIGICLEGSEAFFFFTLRWEYNAVMFSHRFDRASGTTIKGFTTGYNFLEKLGLNN